MSRKADLRRPKADCLQTAIHIAAMADPPDQDAVGRVIDLVDDAPVADSNAVALVSRELLSTGRTWIARERAKAAEIGRAHV